LREIHEVGEAILEALVGFLGPRIEYPGAPDARNGKPNGKTNGKPGGKPNARSNGNPAKKDATKDDTRRASGGAI
jgi:hypothetical protein